LLIYSSGNVTLFTVTADGNNNGIYIDNTSGTGTVEMTNIFTDSNNWTGVDVRSAGSITIDNLNAGGSTVGTNLDTTAGDGNIFVAFSTFNGNSSVGIRAVTSSGNITVDQTNVDGGGASGSFGAWLKSYGGGSIVVSNSSFLNADTGLFVVGTDDVLLDNVTATGNAGDGAKVESGWVFGCFGPDGIAVTVQGGVYEDIGGYGFVIYPGPGSPDPTLAGTISTLNNGAGPYDIDLTKTCVPGGEEKPSKPYQVVEISGKGDDPVQPDCDLYSGAILILPDLTQIKVSCPAEEAITVTTVGEDDLPGPLPRSVTLIEGLVVVSGDTALLPGGGSVQMCFAIPDGMEGKHFAIMYWDPTANGGAGAWIELPMNQFGGQIFQLHPDTPEDGMLILEGVYQKGNCMCVRVNFTGTFVLVAR
jgi:hypothetical protein